ncbi:MAG: ABC transporter permease, partial [Pseudomonadota bacterium]
MAYATANAVPLTAETDGQMLAADGTPLKKKLRQALFLSRARAFGLVAPLLLFILASFIVPIIMLLWQGVHNDTYERYMPRSTPLLAAWDGASPPSEELAAALVADLAQAREDKNIGKVATRVNRELSGTRSLFTKTGRRAADMEAPFLAALEDRDSDWAEIETWQAMKIAAKSYTPAFYAAAVDMTYNADG